MVEKKKIRRDSGVIADWMPHSQFLPTLSERRQKKHQIRANKKNWTLSLSLSTSLLFIFPFPKILLCIFSRIFSNIHAYIIKLLILSLEASEKIKKQQDAIPKYLQNDQLLQLYKCLWWWWINKKKWW